MAEADKNATILRTGFPLCEAIRDELTRRSPILGGILKSSEITRIVDAYKREDARANEVQGRFSRVATHLNVSVLATAAVGALILAVGLVKDDPTWKDAARWVMGTLGFIGLIVSGYGAARLYELNAGDLARDWMRTRARAEQLRREYFDRLVARAIAADAATQAAALELVTKHLLEDQLDYFGRRGTRHEAAAARWMRWAGFATGIAAVGTAAGGMAGALNQNWILAVAALGAIGGAVAAFAAAQEAIGQERNRAQRFHNNVQALELVARQVDDVRTAVIAGSSEALVTFTATINQQLALELGQFLESGDSIRASIAKLSDQIEKSRNEKGREETADAGAAPPSPVPGAS